MHAVHLRLIGKLVVDFLLVIIELFSLAVRAEALQVNIDWTVFARRKCLTDFLREKCSFIGKTATLHF